VQVTVQSYADEVSTDAINPFPPAHSL